jgi:hypothetical protein
MHSSKPDGTAQPLFPCADRTARNRSWSWSCISIRSLCDLSVLCRQKHDYNLGFVYATDGV